jgi:hypothetical protein
MAVDGRFSAVEWQLSGGSTDRSGSITPIRFLEQLTFDQLLVCPSSPIFEPPLWRFLDRACDDELRLQRLETGHSRREYSWV